jgi:outer membrane biosynthesis protein TonB
MDAPPEAMLAEAPAPAVGRADRQGLQDAEALAQDFSDLAAKKSGGQGKKLIVVGIVAAGLAFAGVYLLQTKPWLTPAAPVAHPVPAAPAPSPVAAPAVPKPGEPSQPAAQPTPQPPAQAAPVKPAEKLATPQPTEAPAKTKPEAVEAAKPVEAAEASKRPGPAAASAKKTASKPTASPPPSAPAPAGQAETVYLVKVRSLPVGAQVLIDGEPMGQTPFQRRMLDMDKPHTVNVRKPGYVSYDGTISPTGSWVKEGNTLTLHVSAKLKKLKGEAAGPSAVPEAQPAPAVDQPEKL